MKLINSSVEFLPQDKGVTGAYKLAEIAGRTCYFSNDRITENSWEKFINMLIERKHTSPLEMGAIYLKMPPGSSIPKYLQNKYSRIVINDGYYYITTNARVIYQNNGQDLVAKYWCEPTEHHVKRVAFRIICSIGIQNELIRHRTASFCVESSRYCGYNKDKFNSELTFVKPYWYDSVDDVSKNTFIEFCNLTEGAYMYLLELGRKPQEAREVLSKAVKTTMVMSAFTDDWEEIIKLRTDSAAHPDIQAIANLIKEYLEDNEFIKSDPREITLTYKQIKDIIKSINYDECKTIDDLVEKFYKS